MDTLKIPENHVFFSHKVPVYHTDLLGNETIAGYTIAKHCLPIKDNKDIYVFYDEYTNTYQCNSPDGVVYRLHADEGPAYIEHFNNRTHYIKDGLLHNAYGPAFTCTDASGALANQEWFIFGQKLKEAYPDLMELSGEIEKICKQLNIDLDYTLQGTHCIRYGSANNLNDCMARRVIPIMNYETSAITEYTFEHFLSLAQDEPAPAETTAETKESDNTGLGLFAMAGIATIGLLAKLKYDAKTKVKTESKKTVESVVQEAIVR